MLRLTRMEYRPGYDGWEQSGHDSPVQGPVPDRKAGLHVTSQASANGRAVLRMECVLVISPETGWCGEEIPCLVSPTPVASAGKLSKPGAVECRPAILKAARKGGQKTPPGTGANSIPDPWRGRLNGWCREMLLKMSHTKLFADRASGVQFPLAFGRRHFACWSFHGVIPARVGSPTPSFQAPVLGTNAPIM